MAIQRIPLDIIQDNPYNPRETYHKKDIDDLAHSIQEVGMLQIPMGRRKNSSVQLAFGGLRKRAYDKLAKKDPEKWGQMPVDIADISDQRMALYAVEENLRRHDITSMELARCVDAYLTTFTDVTEEVLAKQLNMTQGNISNMRRVLKLPDLMLEKINAGTINFTMGRELLVLADLPDARELMSQVVAGLQFGNKTAGYPCTVEGIQKSIDYVCSLHLKTIKGGRSWAARPDFDTKECNKCERLIITHPDKTSTNAYCKNVECWDKKQEAHRKAAGEAAIKKMREDLAKKVAVEAVTISQEIPPELEKRADERDRKLDAEKEAATAELEVEEIEPQAVSIPKEVLELAKEKVGTRAEVLDLKDLKVAHIVLKGMWGHDELRNLDDPDECASRCTQGFHYAYDSSYRYDGYGKDESGLVYFVCTNPKCIAQKKGALTRKKNADGLHRKNTEKKAIKEALEMTKSLGRAQMNLILLAHTEDRSFNQYYGSSKSPSKWLWDRLSAGTPSDKRTDTELWKMLNNLSDEEIARLITEMMFARLTYSGDNLQDYEIRTAKPLKWFGIEIPVGEVASVQ